MAGEVLKPLVRLMDSAHQKVRRPAAPAGGRHRPKARPRGRLPVTASICLLHATARRHLARALQHASGYSAVHTGGACHVSLRCTV